MFEIPRDQLIFTLALADCISSLFVAPLGFAASVHGMWTSGRAGCVWYGFVSTWTGLSSISLLAGIAGERYFTLANPNLRWASFCKKRTKYFIAFVCTVSGIASAFPLIGWSKYDFEGKGYHCSIVWSAQTFNYGSYSIFLLLFFFTFPLGLIIYSYTKIYFLVQRMSNDAESMWGKNGVATRQSYIAQVRVARQLALLTGMFLFAWTPYAVMSFLSLTGAVKLDEQASMLPALFAKMSYIYNPLVYYFTFKRLRRRSLQLFKSSAYTQDV
ncbi:opsin-VA-like [Dendronephthya gigantea]|uniref:opsin-VA-like n=1 Tax=Dendronephthya gigantea TaxID=151771 RepID=UPI001069A54C|nr:opsin-VA-like [Dendronephthya gigantea]